MFLRLYEALVHFVFAYCLRSWSHSMDGATTSIKNVSKNDLHLSIGERRVRSKFKLLRVNAEETLKQIRVGNWIRSNFGCSRNTKKNRI